jgi:O-antigen ligase/polysaccharide polymerase Wzy-like membrane protein
MAGLAEELPAAPAAPRRDSHPLPVTRPRGWLAFLLPLPVAAALGLGAGTAPQLALTVTAAAVSALVLVARVEWAALAVIGSAVFEGYLSHLSPWATEWLFAVLVVAWLVRRAQGPLHARRLALVALPVLGVVLAVALAFAVHPHGRAGVDVAASYVELAVVMLLLADVLCGPLAPRRAARLYVLSCVAASVCGIVTAIGSDRHRVLGPVANPDTLAFFLVAAVPLVGTVRTRSEGPVWWVWACFAALVVAGVGTQSRPAFVALVAMVVVAVATGVLALRHAGALIAVVTTGVALVIAVLPLPIGQALTDPQRYSEANITQRNDFRLAALEMTRAAPVVGLGPAAFPLFHQDHRAVDPSERDLDTAYSTVLEASAELGVLGVLALAAAWLLPAVAARRRWLRDRSLLTAAVLLAMDGLLTASLLESAQYVLPLWFLAAMAFAQGAPVRPRTPIFAVAGSGRSGEGSSGQVGPRS